MAKKLFIPLDMFTATQQIFVVEENNQRVVASAPTINIGEIAASFATINHINDVEISGNAEFISAVVDRLKYFLKTTYNNENVRITVNGKVSD